MAKYAIEIKELLSRTVVVEANTLTDAINIVQEVYDNGDIILGAEDFGGTESIDANSNFIGGEITDEQAKHFSRLEVLL